MPINECSPNSFIGIVDYVVLKQYASYFYLVTIFKDAIFLVENVGNIFFCAFLLSERCSTGVQ